MHRHARVQQQFLPCDQDCFDRTNAFPNIGAGIQHVIKRKEGIVANLEFAAGKDGNYGLYMKMGYYY